MNNRQLFRDATSTISAILSLQKASVLVDIFETIGKTTFMNRTIMNEEFFSWEKMFTWFELMLNRTARLFILRHR